MLMLDQANGSVEKSADGKIIGSRLIGQQWTDPQWFHGRPSATVNLSDPTKASFYNAANTKPPIWVPVVRKNSVSARRCPEILMV